MINYKQVLKQKGISEDDLPQKCKRYIKQYNSAMQEITKIETIPGYRNKETKEFTEKAKNMLTSVKDRAEDYNERIIEEISLYVDEMEQEAQKSIEQKEGAKDRADNGGEYKQEPKRKGFWWRK